MKKISFSTWLLVGLVIFAVSLTAALLIFTPQETWTELWTTHGAYRGAFRTEYTAAGEAAEFVRHRAPRFLFPFWIILLAIPVAVLTSIRFRFRHRRDDASLSILEERFAEGKIDEAEFVRKRSVLVGMKGGAA